MSTPKILIIDDCPHILANTTYLLEDNDYHVVSANSPEQAKVILDKESISLILLDMNYSEQRTSGEEGLNFLEWQDKQDIGIPIVAMTGWSNIELAVKAMQIGACDFIEKPWKPQRFLQIIQQQLAMASLKDKNIQLEQRLEPEKQDEFQWQSPCMLRLMQQIENVATTDVSILLTGENGTGKSQLARVIHNLSDRKSKPFVAVNMGAIAESLFESEMFGHKKGAFTDAKTQRIGRFELANTGTIFLDEIANIPLSQQAKLLHVLESGEFEMLGSSQTKICEARIISASNGDFDRLIAEEKFRKDLFYRLNTLEFRVPSLMERDEDIVPLAEYFLAIYARKYKREILSLAPSTQTTLKTYHWPGNLREFSHIMERAVLLCTNEVLEADDLNINKPQQQTAGERLPQLTLEEAEKTLIKQALAFSNNNIPKTAELLGLTRSSLYRRFDKFPDIKALLDKE